MRSGAESPDDRLLNLERHGEHSAGAPPPTPRHPPDLVGDQLCLRHGQRRPEPWAGSHDLYHSVGVGVGEGHTALWESRQRQNRERDVHTRARTRRVLNQAAAGLTGLTGQQRRRRQKERASEPEAPGRVAGGGGERRRGVWTRRGPHDVLRSVASTWHQPWGTGDVHSSRKLGHALPRSPPTCGSLGDGDLVFRGDVPPPPPLQPARGSVSGATGTPAPQGAQSTRPPPSPAVGPAGTGRLSARLPV